MDALKRSLGINPNIPRDLEEERRLRQRQQSRQRQHQQPPVGEAVDMRTKFLSMWNSIKFGRAAWSLDPGSNSSFSRNKPVWLLGQCYHRKVSQSLEPSNPIPIGNQVHSLREEDAGIEAFTLDFASRIWLTYRREFEEFRGTSINTDCGWGCMIRSGQMLLANTLLLLHLGRDWRWKVPNRHVFTGDDLHDESMHRSIVRLFGDSPQLSTSPLSIHQLVSIANTDLGRRPGDWFGPSSTSYLIQTAVSKATEGTNPQHPVLMDLKVYVARDCTVYREDIRDLCSRSSSSLTDSSFDIVHLSQTPGSVLDYSIIESPVINGSGSPSWSPVLILVPLRLGGERLNPIYGSCIKALLASENCVGIIGGRPKHSLYFLGFQDDNLIHLDPHLVQDRVDVFRHNFSLETFHCRTPRKMSLSKMDPSCCFGFLLTSRSQFEGWCELTKELTLPFGQEYPMFGIVDGKSSSNSIVLDDSCGEDFLTSSDDGEQVSEDFVFL